MNSITAGDKTRVLSRHMIDNPHRGVTKAEVAYVLDNWALRGVFTDRDGRQSRVNTAFADTQATRQFARGNWSYFPHRLQEMETRDVAESSL